MSITPFGLIFIALGFVILITRPEWLLSLLIVSAVLHAFSVANISPTMLSNGPSIAPNGIGITPWLYTCGLILIHLNVIVIRNRHIELRGVSHQVTFLFWGWMIFIGWCVLSAFTLPFIFESTPVHSIANKIIGLNGPMVPLAWNLTGTVLAANSIFIGMLFVYVLQFDEDTNFSKYLMSGFIAAVLISIIIGFYQGIELSGMPLALANEVMLQLNSHRLELIGITSSPFHFLYHSLNSSYAPGFSAGRINWPFSEPSYASVWYSGISIGGFAVYLFADRQWRGVSFLVAGLSGLLGSQGGSGFAGFAFALIILINASVVIFWKQKPFLKQVLRRLTLVIVLIGLLTILYEMMRHSFPNLPDLYSTIHSILNARISGPIEWRGQSNLDAIVITKDTWGLGVGLGSNRASSYLLSMMSNIGIPGLVLFLILVSYQLYLLITNLTENSTQKAFIFGGTIGMFAGLVMGISDLMFPAWWIWLISGFCILVSAKRSSLVRAD
jgi:hypothetical protein